MYDGPGVPLGSTFHKLLYALKFGDSNILLSSQVNEDSKILYDRSPEERVQKVAPWLTLDSDAFPAVVDGRIQWIVDGYTTSNRFAGSAKRSMTEMTSDSTQPRSTYATLPSDQQLVANVMWEDAPNLQVGGSFAQGFKAWEGLTDAQWDALIGLAVNLPL